MTATTQEKIGERWSAFDTLSTAIAAGTGATVAVASRRLAAWARGNAAAGTNLVEEFCQLTDASAAGGGMSHAEAIKALATVAVDPKWHQLTLSGLVGDLAVATGRTRRQAQRHLDMRHAGIRAALLGREAAAAPPATSTSGTPAAFLARVRSVQTARGCTRHQAVGVVAREDPAGHRRWVDAGCPGLKK